MNANLRWGLATLACVGVALATAGVVVKNHAPAPLQATARAEEPVTGNSPSVPVQQTAQAEESEPANAPPVPVQGAARAEESVKLLVAFSRPLLKYTTQVDPTALLQLLFESELRTPGGKRIVIERVAMSSR